MSESNLAGGQEVIGVARVEGPIIVVEGGGNIGYDEVVEVVDFQRAYAAWASAGGGPGYGRGAGVCRYHRVVHCWYA